MTPTELFVNVGTAAPTLGVGVNTAPPANTQEIWTFATISWGTGPNQIPAATASQQLRFTIDGEVCLLSNVNVAASTGTVTRAQEGSTAATHLANTPILFQVTAGALAAMLQQAAVGSPQQGLTTIPAAGVLATPAAPTSAVVSAVAGNVNVGSHVWAVADTNANGPTSASATITATTTAGNQQVVLTFAASTGTGKNIYRSMAGQTSPLFFVASVGAGVTTYTDNTADLSMGSACPPAVNLTGGYTVGWDYVSPRGFFNVAAKQYGADPTGTADSSAAINAAISDAGAAGGTVYYPAGSYKCNSDIGWNFNSRSGGPQVTFLGDGPGATILWMNNARLIDAQGAAYNAGGINGTSWNTQYSGMRYQDMLFRWTGNATKGNMCVLPTTLLNLDRVVLMLDGSFPDSSGPHIEIGVGSGPLGSTMVWRDVFLSIGGGTGGGTSSYAAGNFNNMFRVHADTFYWTGGGYYTNFAATVASPRLFYLDPVYTAVIDTWSGFRSDNVSAAAFLWCSGGNVLDMRNVQVAGLYSAGGHVVNVGDPPSTVYVRQWTIVQATNGGAGAPFGPGQFPLSVSSFTGDQLPVVVYEDNAYDNGINAYGRERLAYSDLYNDFIARGYGLNTSASSLITTVTADTSGRTGQKAVGTAYINGQRTWLTADYALPAFGASTTNYITLDLNGLIRTKPNLPVAPTVANATGGTLPVATYGAVVTWVDSNGIETPPSAGSTVTTTSGNASITVTGPSAQTGYAGYYVYLTGPNGNTYYRQQAVGSPTAFGANYSITSGPPLTGSAPPFLLWTVVTGASGVTSTTDNRSLGHNATQGTTPVMTNLATHANTAMSVTGTDMGGQLKFTSAATTTTGSQVHVAFANPFVVAPKTVLVSCTSTAGVLWQAVNITTTGFDVSANTVAASTAFTGGYVVVP